MLLKQGVLQLWQKGFAVSRSAWLGGQGLGEAPALENVSADEEVEVGELQKEDPEEDQEDREPDPGASKLGDAAEEAAESQNDTAWGDVDVAAAVEVTESSEGTRASGVWFLREEVHDPPGFAGFRQKILSLQERGAANPGSVGWVVFTASIGLGNWMLGLSSALLVAGLTGRAFAWIPASMKDACTWMDSPLCSWATRAPSHIIQEADKVLEALAAKPRLEPQSFRSFRQEP